MLQRMLSSADRDPFNWHIVQDGAPQTRNMGDELQKDELDELVRCPAESKAIVSCVMQPGCRKTIGCGCFLHNRGASSSGWI